jgi:predicted DCC family thiol-disulfide oxidoreductase YuxK
VENAAKKTLVYDGTCKTCRIMKSAADTTTSGYNFVDSESEEGKKIITENNLDIEKSAYLIDQGRVVSHSDMALEVVHDVRFIGPLLARVIRIVPSERRDRMYEWLVRHRIR